MVIVFLITEIELAAALVTTISNLLSPSISPIAMPRGVVPVVYSTFVAKLMAVVVEVFCK